MDKTFKDTRAFILEALRIICGTRRRRIPYFLICSGVAALSPKLVEIITIAFVNNELGWTAPAALTWPGILFLFMGFTIIILQESFDYFAKTKQSLQVTDHENMMTKINAIIENNNQILDEVNSLKIINKNTNELGLTNKLNKLSNKLNESKEELSFFKLALKAYFQAKAASEILKDKLIRDKGKISKEHIIKEILRTIRNYCEVSYENKIQGECYFRVIYWVSDGKGSLKVGGYAFNEELNQSILSKIMDLQDGSNIISKSYNDKHIYVLSKNDNDNFTHDYYIDDEFTKTSIAIPVSLLDKSDIYGVVTIDTRVHKYFSKDEIEMDMFEDQLTLLLLELAYTERLVA